MGDGQCYSVIEHFPGIWEALNSIPRTRRRAKTQRGRRRIEKEGEKKGEGRKVVRERKRGEIVFRNKVSLYSKPSWF